MPWNMNTTFSFPITSLDTRTRSTGILVVHIYQLARPAHPPIPGPPLAISRWSRHVVLFHSIRDVLNYHRSPRTKKETMT